MEYFDLMAKEYDTDVRIKRAKAIADEIRLHIAGGQIKTALEYGCGTGLAGFQLLNDFDSILFADSSPEMIEQVKQKLLVLKKSTETAICCDFMTDSPQDLSVDCIFSVLVLHHIKDTKTILSRLYSALRDGGQLLMIDINTDDGGFHANHPGFDGHNGFDQSALIDLAVEAGFRKAEAKTFYHGSKTAGEEEKPYSLFILDAMR
ncbi:MAG: methyltransferase [Oscillospiraceae bacterium]|nr:methyltransferase [Oscillospiraceae bacterium]